MTPFDHSSAIHSSATRSGSAHLHACRPAAGADHRNLELQLHRLGPELYRLERDLPYAI
jgi:hypothetical protein